MGIRKFNYTDAEHHSHETRSCHNIFLHENFRDSLNEFFKKSDFIKLIIVIVLMPDFLLIYFRGTEMAGVLYPSILTQFALTFFHTVP